MQKDGVHIYHFWIALNWAKVYVTKYVWLNAEWHHCYQILRGTIEIISMKILHATLYLEMDIF